MSETGADYDGPLYAPAKKVFPQSVKGTFRRIKWALLVFCLCAMNILAILLPVAIGLGVCGLLACLWAMRTGQFDDLEGAGWRAIADDDLPDPLEPETKPPS